MELFSEDYYHTLVCEYCVDKCINLNELIFKYEFDWQALSMECSRCGQRCEKYKVACHPSEQHPVGQIVELPGPIYCIIENGDSSTGKIIIEFCSAACVTREINDIEE